MGAGRGWGVGGWGGVVWGYFTSKHDVIFECVV